MPLGDVRGVFEAVGVEGHPGGAGEPEVKEVGEELRAGEVVEVGEEVGECGWVGDADVCEGEA